jgi:hypothetical protein
MLPSVVLCYLVMLSLLSYTTYVGCFPCFKKLVNFLFLVTTPIIMCCFVQVSTPLVMVVVLSEALFSVDYSLETLKNRKIRKTRISKSRNSKIALNFLFLETRGIYLYIYTSLYSSLTNKVVCNYIILC